MCTLNKVCFLSRCLLSGPVSVIDSMSADKNCKSQNQGLMESLSQSLYLD